MATTRKTTSATTTAKAKPTTKSAVSMAKEAAAKAAAKPTAKSTPADGGSVVVNSPVPVVAGPVMRKRELIDAVVTKSGIKKKDAKPVIEAMLQVLGSALQDGRELNLQPLGKIKVNREKKMAEGKVLMVKIRQARDLPASVVAAEQEQDSDVGTTAAAE